MTILFRRIKPCTFPITIDLIAKFLGIPKSMIVRIERWAYVLFVHRCDKGGQFISYRKLAMWIEAIASLIQKSSTLDDLWQVGLWIKQECEKFEYTKPVLEYLRSVWAKHRDYLRDLQEPRLNT
jgi:cytochrome P450